jgi:hypothetical protein
MVTFGARKTLEALPFLGELSNNRELTITSVGGAP